MVKTWPEERRPGAAIVKISDPAMEWHEVDLNDLLACCKRELAFRQRCYPRWIDKGTIKPAKAAREIELMGSVCEFLVHCIFKAVTRASSPTWQAPPDAERPLDARAATTPELGAQAVALHEQKRAEPASADGAADEEARRRKDVLE
jgi:hypothetical protein